MATLSKPGRAGYSQSVVAQQEHFSVVICLFGYLSCYGQGHIECSC